jgi:hypothetical protein
MRQYITIHGLQESLWFIYEGSTIVKYFIEFGPMKLVRPVEMCLNGMYSKARKVKHFSDTFLWKMV